MATNYISKILIGSVEYEIKDTVARQGGVRFILSTDAASTPYGVKWTPQGGSEITGTLTAANGDHHAIYLVPSDKTYTQNVYREFVTVLTASTPSEVWAWEQLGDTEVDLSDVVTNVTLNKGSGDSVLGVDTTFTNAASAVSFSGQNSDTFVKSYPGSSSKLETATIKGVGDNVTFNAVDTVSAKTATNTVFGQDTTASKIVTESKTATNLVLGTATTASKATAGTAVSVAQAGTPVTQVLSGDVSQVFTNASVTDEVLSFTTVSVTKNSITPASSNGTITPYTFTDVTVPVVTSNDSVTVASVKTNTDVTVPVVTSNTEVTASAVTTVSKTAATAASSATTVATGSLKADDTVGATVMTGLGTAVTASAVTAVGTGTAAAQTITVGTGDQVSVAKYNDLSLTVTKGNQA